MPVCPSAKVPNFPDPLQGDSTCCAVESFGVVKVPVADIGALRKSPAPPSGRRLPPSLLKHADHQSVLAVSALFKAVHESGWQDRSFEKWGIIAAPRFPGRIISAAAMHKFKTQGVPGMSPLIIPTLSLHAMAASLSLALGTHGFNYGVGGGHGHLAEALLAGLAAADDCGVEGVWVVATQFSPEPVPDTAGNSLNLSFGYGVALALKRVGAGQPPIQLRVVPTASAPAHSGDARVIDGEEPPGGLVALAELLTASETAPRVRRWYSPLPGGGALVIDADASRPTAAGDHHEHSAARAG
jgi:hypothetical protein